MMSSIQLSPAKHLDNISKMFRKLYQDEQLTDCTLYCKDGYIKAHKLILATSSPYFHRIFTETYNNNNNNNNDNTNIYNQHNNHHTVLIMHGISYQNLQNLIELIYKGHVDVMAESVNPLYELAGEFQLSGITGILRSTDTDNDNNNNNNNNINIDDGRNNKGLKRTNSIDIDDNIDNTKVLKQSNDNNNSVDNTNNTKKSAWAKKQRKFKCDLCPSSFKRSSHLTRHQLVHTGERPYACNQCDKAFSRHDKLKHHIKKTHIDDNNDNNNVQLYQNDDDNNVINIDNNDDIGVDDNSIQATLVNLQKRPRGRPRKYPISQLLERQQQLMKRGRGRPRNNNNNSQQQQQQFGENYDITNLPYGDLEYLTMPLDGGSNNNNVVDNGEILQQHDSVIIEPYIEIKTECDSKESIDVVENKFNIDQN